MNKSYSTKNVHQRPQIFNVFCVDFEQVLFHWIHDNNYVQNTKIESLDTWCDICSMLLTHFMAVVSFFTPWKH